MASLQSSCTALGATAPKPRIPSSSAKPSHHLLPSARLSRRFRVSCSGSPAEEGKVDRRNMLLGLGGMYGAANLVSDGELARAAPLLPPEFKSCGVAYVGDDPLDVNCCPPTSDVIKDYKLPPVHRLRVRRAAHRLHQANVAKYKRAVKMMRDLDVSDPTDPRGFSQQANIHCAYCNGAHDQVGHEGLDIQVHFSWLFFPFHRWYLYFYERIMADLLKDPTFALPYWNWDHPKGMQLPGIFDEEDSSLYDPNRNQDRRPPAVLNLALNSTITDPAQIISNNLSLMYNEMIGTPASATDFMGKAYRDGDAPPTYPDGGTSEKGSHTGIHAWFGDPRNEYNEDIGNFYSAGRDPAFYSHHANVDRMWTIWNEIPADYPKAITDPDYLNASFLFYDEKKQLVRVKVADSFNHKKMGYDYENVDIPWVRSKPPQKAAAANIQDLSKGVKTAEKLFPLKLKKTTRVLVPKPTVGKADEVLVLENIVTDNRKLIKFDVFVNDEDDKPEEVDRAEYAGGFTQLPHRVKAKNSKSDLRLNLKQLYENINIADDDSVVVTIVPLINGESVTIGGIKIVEAPSV
ncbi:catechol oxidase [Salvia divinorum]|uniref:Catechol oxidase n=1 Tax=Salvia divinorum TaxID=28513 RepID=A0ABD1G2Q8_SALDI